MRARAWLARLAVALCAPGAVTAGPADVPVRFLVTESATMPLARIERQPDGAMRLVDGLLRDWQDALAQGLGRPAVVVIVPRRREEAAIAAGEADVRCTMSPEWVSPAAQGDYLWPAPWLQVREVLVGPPGTAALGDESGFRGQRVGTVAGYHYPRLERYFAVGRLVRDDAPTEAAALAKLQRGYVSLGIMREMDLRYLQLRQPGGVAFESAAFVVNAVPMHCGVARAGRVTLDRFEAVQQQLIQAGVLQQIARRYLGNSPANEAFAGPRVRP